MKMAKADAQDVDSVREFFQMLEEVLEYGTYTPPNDEHEEESIDVDDETLMSMIRERWGIRGPGVGASWRRVVMGYAVLVGNCCDPDADTLEWRPDIQKMLEAQQTAATEGAA